MRLFFTLLLSLSILGNISIAQDIVFSDAADLPKAKSALTSAVAGDKIYVANGFSESEQYTTEVYVYDTDADSWSTLTDQTIPKRFASTEVVGDFLYLFNGVTTGGELNTAVEKISLLDGSIELLTANPSPVTAAGVAVHNNKIYSFGGSESPNVFSNKLNVFDPSTNLWTRLADMPRTGQVKGEIVAEKLYVIGGFNGATSDRVEVYDIATDTWESSIGLPVGLSANVTAVAGTRIYSVGDFSAQGTLAYLDTQQGTYTDLTNNLMNRRHGAAEVVNGVLYAIGGNTASDITTSTASVQRATTGVSSVSRTALEYVEVFPNPTTDVLQLPKQYATVKLYDNIGREVATWNDAKFIDVHALEPGIYRLELSDVVETFGSSFLKK